MKKTLFGICGAALVCGFGLHASANAILTDNGPGFVVQSAGDSTRGYDFTVGSTPLMVTALGLWDGPPPLSVVGGDGFLSAHQIGLWDNSGNLLASATMQIGTGDTLIGEFRYSSTLTPTNPGPVILAANTKYVLGASYLGSPNPDTLTVNNGVNQATFDPAVSPGNARQSNGGFSFPNTDSGPGSVVGPNALFTLVTNGNGVPEGGSALMLMAIAVAICGSVKALKREALNR